MLDRRAIAFAFLAIGGVGETDAQDLEPRQYSNAPIGLNFFVAGYVNQAGSVLFDPALLLENADLSIDGPAVGYARSLAFGGMSGKIDMGVARVCLSGSADYQGQKYTRDVCGLTDAKVRVGINFIGAPALTMQEFAGNRQNLVVGASLQLAVPVGDYDPARLANIGTNRWATKAELGVSKARGPWTLEIALASTFHETNDEFFGGSTREQDPIYSLQAHVVRSFKSGVWLALDWNHYRGGETTTNGTVNSDFQSNERLGLTLSLPVNSRQSVKINTSSGVSTRTGTDFDTIGAYWQYRWGGGL
ncbi:MAG TPA: transporter [Gammaproteobacteria bacterium]